MPLGISVMFYGALLRSYFIDKQSELRNPIIILSIFYIVCLFFATKLYYQDGWLKWFLSHIFAFMMFFALITKVKLRNSFFVYIGRISYSLYLLHSLMIGVAFYLLGDFSYTNLGFYFVLILVFILSVLMADISYRIIESPSISLGSKLTVKYKNIKTSSTKKVYR
jgi:peptidoglycan/LPS O-acetylase OafA/YrhL